MHHVGQVTLDDPEVAGRPEPHLVAAVTSSMLREIKPFAGAGDIVAGESDDHAPQARRASAPLASEYDDLTVVDGTPPDVAFETLRTAPRYIYDERVLSALERAVGEQHQLRGLTRRSRPASSRVGRGSAKFARSISRGSAALPFVLRETAWLALAARVEGQVAEPDRDDQVAEAQRRVERRARAR